MGQEAVFLCPKMVIALGALVTMVSAMIHSGNSTMQVDRPPVEMTNPAAHTPEGDASSEDFTDSLDEVWMRAEERYGLVRPEPGETVIAVHRQTSQRFALSPDTWDEIPVHFEMPPRTLGENDLTPIEKQYWIQSGLALCAALDQLTDPADWVGALALDGYMYSILS